ncbi:hypothetical protein [Nitratireductor luteus]|uniref:hypothetical protein n=1 Tax=Nitratireductor luteus TaxID=2976980 RepID=UPI00223F161E|nr:hypothetical protein [Nitratireductor luteus]
MPSNKAHPFPLVTSKRLQVREQVHTILSETAAPYWVRGIVSPYPEPEAEPDVPALAERIVLLGDAHPQQFHFSAAALAIGYELCRTGHSWGTNDNHSEARNVYAQMIFSGAFQANLPVARLFTDAGAGQIVKYEGRPYDLTSENLMLIPGPRAKREARAVAMEHAERLAWERPERLPAGVTVEEYLANLHQLFAYHDELAGILKDTGKPAQRNGEEAA